MRIELDVTDVLTLDALHEQLARTLHFPDWYGRNPDALLDCLSEQPTGTELVLLGVTALKRRLGLELEPILSAFSYAAQGHNHFTVTLLP